MIIKELFNLFIGSTFPSHSKHKGKGKSQKDPGQKE